MSLYIFHLERIHNTSHLGPPVLAFFFALILWGKYYLGPLQQQTHLISFGGISLPFLTPREFYQEWEFDPMFVTHVLNTPWLSLHAGSALCHTIQWLQLKLSEKIQK